MLKINDGVQSLYDHDLGHGIYIVCVYEDILLKSEINIVACE